MKKIWCFFIILLLLPIMANAKEKIPTFLYGSEKEISINKSKIMKIDSEYIYIIGYDTNYKNLSLYKYKKLDFSLVNQKILLSNSNITEDAYYDENDNYIYIFNLLDKDSTYEYELIKYDLDGKKIDTINIDTNGNDAFFYLLNNYIYYGNYNSTEIKKLNTNGNLVSTIDTGTNIINAKYYFSKTNIIDKLYLYCGNYNNICTLTEDDQLEVTPISEFKPQANSYGDTKFYYNSNTIYKYDKNDKVTNTKEVKNIEFVVCTYSYCYIFTYNNGVIITDYDLKEIKNYNISGKHITSFSIYNDKIYTIGADSYGSGSPTRTYYFNGFGINEEEQEINMLLSENYTLGSVFKELQDYTGEINWNIEDKSVLKIEDGKIIPLKIGTTTIQCKVLGRTYFINVNITEVKEDTETKETKNPLTSDSILITLMILIMLSAIVTVIKNLTKSKKYN